MIPVPANVRIWIATSPTDMRRAMGGLALQVQEILKRDTRAGDLYLFRGNAIQPDLSTASVMMASSARGRLGAMCRRCRSPW
ncbi:IS66 family insertion sequence element accessory protein TnpB [Lichenicoccus sp.]|uniref:IS66 family insertion sequence element accessory protein TnpB n=1 Tax=Lichenicoccus sp. TaxID=2781899 RepID=UPI003D0E4429